MDKAKILRLLDEADGIVSALYRQGANKDYKCKMLREKLKAISAEITAPPKTNADRIRQMTDEELASVIGFNECKDAALGYECPAWIQPHCDGECKKHFLAWLKQEVKTDD